MSRQLRLSFTLQDELGVRAVVPFFVSGDDSMTLSDVDALLQALGGALRACTSGQIVAIRASMYSIFTGTNDAPASGSRTQQTGVMDLSNTTNTRLYGLAIPAILDSLVSGRVLVTGSGPLADLFVDLHDAGVNYHFTSEDGISQVGGGLVRSYLTFRKRDKRGD